MASLVNVDPQVSSAMTVHRVLVVPEGSVDHGPIRTPGKPINISALAPGINLLG